MKLELNAALGIIARSDDEAELMEAAREILMHKDSFPREHDIRAQWVRRPKSDTNSGRLTGHTGLGGDVGIEDHRKKKLITRDTFEAARVGYWRVWRHNQKLALVIQEFREYHEEGVCQNAAGFVYTAIEYSKNGKLIAVVEVEKTETFCWKFTIPRVTSLRVIVYGSNEHHLTGAYKGRVFRRLFGSLVLGFSH